MVIGDSKILIQAMVTNTLPNQMNLRQISKKILWLSHSFHKIDFFHVLRQLNGEADQAAKAATPLSKGQLSINGTYALTHSLNDMWRVLSWTSGACGTRFSRLLDSWQPSGDTSVHPLPRAKVLHLPIRVPSPLLAVLCLPSLMSLCSEPIPLPHGTRARPFQLMETHVRSVVKFGKVVSYSCLSCSFDTTWSLAWLVLSAPPPAHSCPSDLAWSPTWLVSSPCFAMASSSNSTSPPNPSPSLELEIRKLKCTLNAHRGFLLHLDEEGSWRFEMVEEDLIQLREEAVEALTHTTQQTNSKIVELEARIEKMELQAAGPNRWTKCRCEDISERKFHHSGPKV
jgi:hypothetical protein